MGRYEFIKYFRVGQLLSKFEINTRIGLHVVNEEAYSPQGLILFRDHR